MSNSLLAGPILRRATANRICVWIATSQRLSIQLDILDATNPERIIGYSKIDNLYTQCIQLGENLFIYLLEAREINNKKFPLDTLLYYQLSTINGTEKETWDLSKLAYQGLTYPSFFIATQSKNILHGSCRKPHGAGSKENSDALLLANEILAANCQNLSNRPSMLFLTGDQIYADDVAITLLATLREKAKALIGRAEYIPTLSDPVEPRAIALHGRKAFLKENKSGFSSGESENHLLSFGEYAAMYIYVFGNLSEWKIDHTWEQLVAQGISNTEEAKAAFNNQASALLSFNKSLPKIRCLLANIPTYMMLDDHDVTDDWNITNSWYDNVKKSNLGQRIVSNALAAYWAFQGGGNDPDNFNLDFKTALHKYLLDSGKSPEISERYDLQMWRHHGWSFSIPSNPPVIALDSRTQRASTAGTFLPELLDRYAKDWMVVEWSKLKTNPAVNDWSMPIIIAPAPVFGFAAINLGQRILCEIAGYIENSPKVKPILKVLKMENFFINKTINTVDVEAWASNNKSLNGLMGCLCTRMHIKQCIFLSGDVHYAFTANGRHSFKDKNIESNIYCYQFTSSSLNNIPSENQHKAIEKSAKFSNSINAITKHSQFFANETTEVHLLPSEVSDTHKEPKYSSADCNIGLIEFENGIPRKHILKTHAAGDIVFKLPELEYIDTLSGEGS